MSQEERNRVMAEMASYEGLAFEPSVGIFCFDPDIDSHWDLGHGWSEHDFGLDVKG